MCTTELLAWGNHLQHMRRDDEWDPRHQYSPWRGRAYRTVIEVAHEKIWICRLWACSSKTQSVSVVFPSNTEGNSHLDGVGVGVCLLIQTHTRTHTVFVAHVTRNTSPINMVVSKNLDGASGSQERDIDSNDITVGEAILFGERDTDAFLWWIVSVRSSTDRSRSL